jgi:hypothetical protein
MHHLKHLHNIRIGNEIIHQIQLNMVHRQQQIPKPWEVSSFFVLNIASKFSRASTGAIYAMMKKRMLLMRVQPKPGIAKYQQPTKFITYVSDILNVFR